MVGRMIFLELPACFMTDDEEEQEKLGVEPVVNGSWGSEIIPLRIEIGCIESYWPYNGGVTLNCHLGKYRINLPIEEFDMIIAENVKRYNEDFNE